jgi:hypothetical protein
VLAAGWVGCASQPSKPVHHPKALDHLKAQVNEVRRAILQEDHQRLTDLPHPRLVEMMGPAEVHPATG